MVIITATTMSAMTRSLIQHLPEYERCEDGQCHDRILVERDMLNDLKANSLRDEISVAQNVFVLVMQ